MREYDPDEIRRQPLADSARCPPRVLGAPDPEARPSCYRRPSIERVRLTAYVTPAEPGVVADHALCATGKFICVLCCREASAAAVETGRQVVKERTHGEEPIG